MASKCTLSNDELIAALQEWNSKLCDTGGRAWTLRVPADPNRDPDMLIADACRRLAELVEAVRWLLEVQAIVNENILCPQWRRHSGLSDIERAARAAVAALVGEG